MAELALSPFTPTRREFLYSLSAVALSQLSRTAQPVALKTFGIAQASFRIRFLQAAQAVDTKGPAIPAEKYIDLCKSFGGDGAQFDFGLLSSTDEDYLKRLRRSLEDKGMFLELTLSPEWLGDSSTLTNAAAVAKELGAIRLRVTFSEKRYQAFSSLQQWKDTSARRVDVLRQAEPILKSQGLILGIENHGDWMADELVEVLRQIGSPHIGACVNFGNSLALLEDPVESAQKLGPYAVTSLLKDMVVLPSDGGCLLADVPLGQGIIPIAKIMEILRKGRSDIHFCLEMITQDPWKVPFKSDKYWAAYSERNEDRMDNFASAFLNKPSNFSPPKVSGMSSPRMLAVEDENIRKCVSYAKRTLGM
ncbi:MAG: TIM barrel protein [Terriglobia bacterium]